MTNAEKQQALKDIDELLVEATDPMELDALLDQRLDVMHTRRTPEKPTFKTDKEMAR